MESSSAKLCPMFFTKSFFQQAFVVAAMESYESLFVDQSEYKTIIGALAGVIYRECGKKKNKRKTGRT